MSLTELCIRRPVLAWMIFAAVVVFGGIAARRLGISQFPDVDFPTISVNLQWEGASPEVLEKDVVEPIEENLAQVEGVKSVTATCRQGSASITVELDLDRDVDAALQDVQTRIAQARQRLPADLDPPVVSKTNPEDNPILWVSVSGALPPAALTDWARFRLREELQQVPGVGEVMMGGTRERMIRIWLDAERLAAHGLTAQDVARAVQGEHVELPAGKLAAGAREIEVRVLGEALDISTLEEIVVGDLSGPLRLRDVALVEDGFDDERRKARFNGLPAQGVGIKKQRGANAVAVGDAVHEVLDTLKADLPEGMRLDVNFDSTRFVRESVEDLEVELLLSVALTALVCWLFLGSISATTNVVLAIPMSLLGTLAILWSCGFTLNTFTLLGLSLAVGIVVDDAIMVLESITRAQEEGLSPLEAARVGTGRIVFAALASSLSVCAIFAPVVFMEGVIGKYFLQFGVTLCAAVLISYLEAVTLTPSRCAKLDLVHHGNRSAIGRAVDGAFRNLEQVYGRTLRVAVRRPWWLVAFGLALLLGTIKVGSVVPRELVPSQDQSRVMVRLTTAVGSSLTEVDTLFKAAEDVIYAQAEVERAFAIVGGFGGGTNGGVIFVTLVPPDRRTASQAEFSGRLRGALNRVPGLRAMVQDLSQSNFTARRGYPVEFSLQGQDWEALVGASERVQAELRSRGLATDIDSDHELGLPELRLVPDRARAADLGVSMEDMATAVRVMVGGARLGKFSTDGRRVDVRMRLLEAQRRRPEDLDRLYLRARSGELVPLSSLVEWNEQPALQAISRKDRERAITVFGNPAPGHTQAEVIAAVKEITTELPDSVRVVFGGASQAFAESMRGLLFALVLGIVVAYMILASQFNSFRHPVTVLSVLPMAALGALGALWAADKTLNMFSMIGLLLLLGLVTKNSILLVDQANTLRKAVEDPREAMAAAGPRRLRPILMTAFSTMAAAVPSAIGLGAGAELRQPMALAVLAGMAVSTFLSLYVVPGLWIVLERRSASAAST